MVGATLVEWLGLVWARVPVLTEVAGQLGCLDCVLVCTFKVDGEHRLCQSASPTQREFQQLFHALVEF